MRNERPLRTPQISLNVSSTVLKSINTITTNPKNPTNPADPELPWLMKLSIIETSRGFNCRSAAGAEGSDGWAGSGGLAGAGVGAARPFATGVSAESSERSAGSEILLY